jgi:hypothetical protein
MHPRHLAGATVLAAFALLALACGGGSPPAPAPQGNATDSKLPTDEQPPKDRTNRPRRRDPAKEKPDVVWSVQRLMDEWAPNGTGLRQQYGGQIIEVTGKVWDFMPFDYYKPTDAILVNLDALPTNLIFHMADREPWAKVIPKQEVTLRGRVPLPDEGIIEPLVQCVIVEPRKTSAIQLTAEELIRDARTDPKKYDRKYLIVEGEVVGKKKVNGLYLELKGDEQTKVRCQIFWKLDMTIDPIALGQKVKVYGQYVTISKDGLLTLDKALPILGKVE